MGKFEDILIQCIDDIKEGTSTIEDCLSEYPSLRERLEPLLRIALQIREAPDIKPSPAFKVRARVQLMEQIHERQAVTERGFGRYCSWMKPTQYRRRFNMAGIIIAIVLVLSAAGGGTVYASQDSLPGDTLYQVKLGTEQVRMILPGGDIGKAELALRFTERRMEEMVALVEAGRAQHMGLAVAKYDEALNRLQARMELVRDGSSAAVNVTTLVAEATAGHLSVLDTVYDAVPDEAKPAIIRARERSLNGQQTALAALTRNDPIRATQMNLQAMNGRLNRARVMAEQGDCEEVENALAQFEEMGMAGEDIAQIAQEADTGVTEVEELLTQANAGHLFILDDLNDSAPHQAGPAIAGVRHALMNRFRNCLMALAYEDPAMAVETNLNAMSGRLERAKASAENAESVEVALEQFEVMADSCEAISRIAHDAGGDGDLIDELIGQATLIHIDALVEVWEKVPELAREAIEGAIARALIRHENRVRAMGQRGIAFPDHPGVPAHMRERINERIREQKMWDEREAALSPGIPGFAGGCPGCRR